MGFRVNSDAVRPFSAKLPARYGCVQMIECVVCSLSFPYVSAETVFAFYFRAEKPSNLKEYTDDDVVILVQECQAVL